MEKPRFIILHSSSNGEEEAFNINYISSYSNGVVYVTRNIGYTNYVNESFEEITNLIKESLQELRNIWERIFLKMQSLVS